jgi:hypothetical protein
MNFLDAIFTWGVREIQTYVVPRFEKKLKNYAPADEEFVCRLRQLQLHPERMYTGAMVHEPWRSQLVMEEIERLKPRLVVECGAGNSTSWLLAMSRIQGFDLVSLENHSGTIDYIKYLLEDTPYAEAFDTHAIGFKRYKRDDGVGYWWYDFDFSTLSSKIDFVFVDGPMSSLVGRGGALYRLWDHLSPTATIFVDDANREREQNMLRDWCRDFPGIEVNYLRHNVLAKVSRKTLA